MGRPTALTPEVQKVIVQALGAGSFIDAACNMAGIDEKSFYTWVKRGKTEKQGVYADFLQAVKKALAGAEVSLVATIRGASKQTWQAAAWMLERRFPARWAKYSDRPKDDGETKQEVQPRLIVWADPDPEPSERTE